MNEALEIIMQYLPTVLAVISLVVTTLRNIKANKRGMDELSDMIVDRVKKTSDELKASNSLQEIRQQLAEVIQDNKKLKRQLSDLLQQLTKVKQNDEDETK